MNVSLCSGSESVAHTMASESLLLTGSLHPASRASFLTLKGAG